MAGITVLIMIGTCKLCGQTGQKLIKAHIIPRSFYGETLTCAAGPAKLVSINVDEHPKKTLKGIYDQKIVCAGCEEKFSLWDNYAKVLLFDTPPDNEITHGSKKLAQVYTAFDYSQLKLFFLSLLWRANSSSHFYFKSVSLGPFADKLQKMVRNNDPGDPEDFAVIITRFDDRMSHAFLDPYRQRLEDVMFYWVSFAEHCCVIKVDGRPTPESLSKFVLSPSQDLYITTRNFRNSPQWRTLVKIAKKRKTLF